MKTLIQAFIYEEKTQQDCNHPRKYQKMFNYEGEYPAGGVRCMKCGKIIKLVATNQELNKGRK